MYGSCSVGIAGGIGRVHPPLNVFNSLVAHVYLSWGLDVTPPPQIAKMSVILDFLVNTWVF